MPTNGAMLSGMQGTPLKSIKQAWDGASKKKQVTAATVVLGVAGLLGSAIFVLGGDFVVGFINEQIVAAVGPWLPTVGQVIASYLFSFTAACGLLWFAVSWGYWLALRYPIAVLQNANEAQPIAGAELDKKCRIALGAVREILQKLSKVDYAVERSYGNKEQTRTEYLQKYRPEIQANVVLLVKAGLATPPVETLDGWEAAGLRKYAQELEPFLAKGLFPQAVSLAADTAVAVTAILSENKPAKR